jgi:hypothetical protein
MFGNRIHRGGNYGNTKGYVPAELTPYINLCGQNLTVLWNKQNIVKR